jgi:hypothetical protein
VHPSIQWAKLQSLAAGARIASKTLWKRAKPAAKRVAKSKPKVKARARAR